MIREVGSTNFSTVEGQEEILPVDRRRALDRLLKPASVAQDYSFPQDVSVPTVRQPKRRTDAEMITMWLQTGKWPERYFD